MAEEKRYAASKIENLPQSHVQLDALIKLQRQELSAASRVPQMVVCSLSLVCATVVLLYGNSVMLTRVAESGSQDEVSVMEFSIGSLAYSGPSIGILALLLWVGLIFTVPKFRYIQPASGGSSV